MSARIFSLSVACAYSNIFNLFVLQVKVSSADRPVRIQRMQNHNASVYGHAQAQPIHRFSGCNRIILNLKTLRSSCCQSRTTRPNPSGGWYYPLWLTAHKEARESLKKEGWLIYYSAALKKPGICVLIRT